MTARVPSWSVVLVGCLACLVIAVRLDGASGTAGWSFEDRRVVVTVLDDQHVTVKGLTTADIRIREDGASREVTDVRPATESMCVALLIDTSKPRQGTQAPTRDLRVGLTALVRGVHDGIPGAEFAVMEFGGAAVMTQSFTASTAEVERRLSRLFPSPQVSAVLLEAVVDVSQAMSRRPCRRRTIVSVDLDSQETSELSGQKISEAVQRAGAALWAISVQRGPTNASAAQRNVLLTGLAEITGGLRFNIADPAALESLLAKIAGALTSQYRVTYKRPDGTTALQITASSPKGRTILATRLAAQ